ncbi:DbpA RNA binding domain-containing protein [Paracoccus marcusii]|uniref:DbpA RNA binding domain-containing protein n=1 Tax=Paracoccus marcusii TaxID=59779 RepID=UPI0039C88906
MLDHPGLHESVGDDAALAAQLLEQFSAEQVAAAFLRLWREGRPAAEELSEAHAPRADGPRAQREFGPSVWFTLSVGHSGRAEARWLLPKVCDAGGITRDSIGAIRVKQDLSYIQIASEVAAKFGDFIEITPEVTMRRMDGAPTWTRRSSGRPVPRAPTIVPRSQPAPRAKHAASDEVTTPASSPPAAAGCPMMPPPSRARPDRMRP